MLRECVRAIFEPSNIGWNEPTVQALEEMRIPEVAEIMLVEDWAAQRVFHLTAMPPVNERTRRRLTRLLGSDAGTDPQKWDALYEATIASAPTPLSPQLRREADAVINGFTKCAIARYRLIHAGHGRRTVSLPNFEVLTTDEFVREADAYVERVGKGINTTGTDE